MNQWVCSPPCSKEDVFFGDCSHADFMQKRSLHLRTCVRLLTLLNQTNASQQYISAAANHDE